MQNSNDVLQTATSDGNSISSTVTTFGTSPLGGGAGYTNIYGGLDGTSPACAPTTGTGGTPQLASLSGSTYSCSDSTQPGVFIKIDASYVYHPLFAPPSLF